MGYTHYWTFPKSKKGTLAETEKAYQLAISQCRRVVKGYNAEVTAIGGDTLRLSGDTVSSEVDQYKGINFNGTDDLSHEDFYLNEHLKQNEFNFCKTARKPYDIVVTACLSILKHYLGDRIEVSSDGDFSDWNLGTDLAKRILDIEGIENPNRKS